MENDAYSSAVKNTLKDITDACPDIQSIFLFKENGDIISIENKIAEENLAQATHTLDDMLLKGEILGGIETIRIQGEKIVLNVAKVDDSYLATVVTDKADLKYVNALTNILFPNILKLLERLVPTPNRESLNKEQNEGTMPGLTNKPIQEPEEKTEQRPKQDRDLELVPERIPQEPHVNQFIVEDIRGLFVSQETVRVDKETFTKWTELYETKNIEEATIESFAGKSLHCRIRTVKNSKLDGKGIIQIPEKLQTALAVKKGQLVRVKPIVR